MQGAGSSPLTRGTVLVGSKRGRGARFIPAHAGNRLNLMAGKRRRAVHPRSRGEQGQERGEGTAGRGSSPLTRGTGPGSRTRWAGGRFIPAHAGNRRPGHGSRCRGAVHPRSRGEQHRTRSDFGRGRGSSPLTRGTVPDEPWAAFEERFIPAHAGNSSDRSKDRPRRPVHPRSRGEQGISICERWLSDGSSPLTRGTERSRPDI